MLTKELTESYKATTYRVPSLNLDIRIDEKIPLLDLILKTKNAETWAFITAWNPESKILSLKENRSRNDMLQSKLEAYQIFEGSGIPENSDWEPEESIFIIGITKEYALELGRKFKQNAIVFGSINGTAELIICI